MAHWKPGWGILQRPLQVPAVQDWMRQREQRGRQLHMLHWSSLRDAGLNATASSTGSRLSKTTVS